MSGAVVFKDEKSKGKLWMLVKQSEDSGWEMPKTTVRKGESSVRAVIRMIGEQAGMNAKVLDEAMRMVGATSLNGKVIEKKTIYYLMHYKAASEAIGFADFVWLEYSKAKTKLQDKKEKEALELAKAALKEWDKNGAQRKDPRDSVDLDADLL